jgi:hypothetical protein
VHGGQSVKCYIIHDHRTGVMAPLAMLVDMIASRDTPSRSRPMNVTAPISSVLDSLSALTSTQHVASVTESARGR